MVPNGWKKFLINEICLSIVPGRNKPKTFDGNIPWVTTPEINGRYLPSVLQVNYISDEAVKEVGAKVVPAGAVIMSAVGELGVVAIAKQPLVINQQLHAFVCTDVINNEYLAYWLETQKPYMESVASKTTILYLNKANCESIPVLAPILPEQEKIAQILSTWDQAISATEKLLKNSQQQKKALMQQLLTGKKRLLDENGKKFSSQWHQIKLSDCFERVTLKNNGKSTNVVTISAQHGLVKQEDFFKKTVASEILDDYFLLQKGQFAYNKSYSNGYPMGAIKRLNKYDNGVVTTLYICFEITNHNESHSDFWEHYFESGILNKGLSQIAHEGGRAHGLLNVKPSDFFDLKVNIPSYLEQKKIASVLTKADQEIETLQKKLDCLKQEKKALMQQLLTGKKRVKVAA